MNVLAASLTLGRGRMADWIELTKPRITLLILLTVLLGFYLGSGGGLGLLLLPTLAGTALITSGVAVLNQVMERDLDARMRRTENRPLPAGRLRPTDARRFGLLLCLSGVAALSLLVNPLTGGVAALTGVSYLGLYTPLKRVTSLSTLVGAFPGALPPVGGWTAATGELHAEAAILFGIVFLWQLPHFLAIAWLYQEDYRRAGVALLPGMAQAGHVAAGQVVLYTTALLPVSLLPAAVGLGGRLYLLAALLLGCLFLGEGLRFAFGRTTAAARRLLLASIIYLPLLWTALMIDQILP
ncbi:MAG: heme o synthase [Acidobacteriota bacterium]